MTIDLICVGKIKESFYREAVGEYAKRLSRFCKFRVCEVAEELLTGTSQKQIDAVKKAEGARLLAYCKGYVIAFDSRGAQTTSEEFSDLICKRALRENSRIALVIGGSYGLDDALKQRADAIVSFGKITFPHQLMRVVAVEQLYRAFMIGEGSAYHK